MNGLCKQWVIVLVISFNLLVFATYANSAVVQAKGVAAILNDDVISARQVALQDAMRQAALQAGAHVQSSVELSNSVIESDNTRVRAMGVVEDMVVLDEWVDQDHDVFNVLIRARVTSQDTSKQELQNRYNYKVAVLQFDVTDRLQIADLPDFEIKFSQVLARRLQQIGGLYAIDASQYSLRASMQPFLASGKTEHELLVSLAEQLGAQFLISGTIKDMGTTEHLHYFELRHAEFEIMVHDGLSGALVSRHAANGSTVQNELFQFPTSTPALNDKFFAAPIGKSIHHILNYLAEKISADVHNLPFTARVLDTRGDHVYIDVGGVSKLQIGDVLMAYSQAESPMLNESQNLFFGFNEKPVSSFTIKRVQPLFAVGEMQGAVGKIKPGDVVRFKW